MDGAAAIVTESEPQVVSGRLPEGVDAPIDESFLKRRSSREFAPEQLPFDVVRTLFEAARFAPSAENLQPWVFVYAADPPTRKRALSLLDPETQGWASCASLLIFVFARRLHPETGAPLRTGAFDTGAAWFSLALQAQKLGLNCRAIGQLDHERAHRVLGVPDSTHESLIAIAVGYPAPRTNTTPEKAESSRKRQHQFVFNGRYLAEREAQGWRSTHTPSGSENR
jgi:nitroreductase